MSRLRRLLPAILLLPSANFAATKPHIVAFGPSHLVKISGPASTRTVRIRRLVIDGRVKEYTTGVVHDVTDRLFVVQRAYRLNDALPEETNRTPLWTWQLGGWISVDRSTGHVAQLNLSGYEPLLSEASWYRDYAAYCGASDDGGKAYMLVSQLGRRRPLLKKEFPGPSCAAPKWERGPSRVTFITADGGKATFVVQGRSADPQVENAGGEEGPQ